MAAPPRDRDAGEHLRGEERGVETSGEKLNPLLLRRVNDLMREGLRRRVSDDPDCFQPVWLTGGEYDLRRADRATIFLAEVHRFRARRGLSPDAPRAA
jgi:hypothetical protein